jgi:hypothetical protein
VFGRLEALALAQPVGFIDPLFEHPCNSITDPDLGRQPKSVQRERLGAIDAGYREGMSSLANGHAQEALGSLLAYLTSVSRYVSPSHHLYLDAMHQIIKARIQLRDYDRALVDAQLNYKTRAQCYGSANQFTIESMAILGVVYSVMGQRENALAATEAVLAGETGLIASMSPERASSQSVRKQLLIAESNVGAASFRLGQTERARAIAPRIVKGTSELDADDPERYELANSSWYLLNRIGQREGGRQQTETVAGLKATYEGISALLGQDHPRTFPLLANYGFALADIDAQRAFPVLGDYVALVEHERLRMRLPADREMFLEGRVGAYQRFTFVAAEAGKILDAFYGVEWSKARSLRDALALRLAIARDVLPSGDAAALRDAERLVSEREAQLEGGFSDREKRQAATARLQEAKSAFARLFDAAAKRSTRFSMLTQSTIQNPTNVGKVLHADEVFISYLTRRVDGPVFGVLVAILEPSGKLSLVSLGNTPGLDQTAAIYSQALSQGEGIAAISRSGNEVWGFRGAFFLASGGSIYPQAEIVTSSEPIRSALSDLLLPQPVRALLAPYKRWIISPAGPLWTIPFETLSDGDAPVIEHHTVRYVHSWTMLSALSSAAEAVQPSSVTPLLVIGDAKYSDYVLPSGASEKEYLRWPDLPFSAREVDVLAKRFSLTDGTNLFRGPAAVRKTVLALSSSHLLGRARVVLLSAHGYLDMQNSELSALVLGRPAGGSERDRYLRARELDLLDLPPGMIVLSSCNSGKGRVASGEGVLGLPYALFAAGAVTAVLTRWDVYDDPVTASMVSDLVSAVTAGRAPDEALAEIQRKVRNSNNEAHWAALVLLGR